MKHVTSAQARSSLLAFAIGSLFLAALLLLAVAAHVPRIRIEPEYMVAAQNGQTTRYTIWLPERPGTAHECLMFKSAGNVITVQSGDQILYAYGESYAAQRRDIGRVYAAVPIPADVSSLTVSLRASDAAASGKISKMELCREQDVARYYLTNDTLGLVPGLFFIVIGFCCLCAALLLGRGWALSRLTACFGGVLLCMAVELLDTGGHYLVFGLDPHTWNILFELDCYIIPIVSTLYAWELVKTAFNRRENAVMRFGVIAGSCAAAAVCCVVWFTPLRFSDFSRFYMVYLIFFAGFAVYGTVQIIRKKLLTRSSGRFVLVLVAWLLIAILLRALSAPLVNRSTSPMIDLETVEAVVVFYVAGSMFIRAVQTDIREQKAQAVRIRQLGDEVRIQRLRCFANQMQPHFLYNTLSSIQEIIQDDAMYASILVGDFTTYLRSCIRSMGDDRPIPFEQELLNIQAYARIEEMRLTDRLKMIYEIKETQFPVVPLSIQPLVENAIRHGIYERGPDGGTVFISTVWQDGCFEVKVKDDGVGFDVETVLKRIQAPDSDAYGLQNSMFRLKSQLNAVVEIQSTVGVGTEITVRIPQLMPAKEDV